MDNFVQELIDIVKLPFNEISKDVKIILLSKKVLYVSNYQKILSYSTEKIILKSKKDCMEIIGSDLQISQINKGEIIIKGNIISFGFGGN